MAVILNGKIKYVGCTIRTWEHNGRDDSDFYADCLDIEKGVIVSVEYDTTRFAGGGKAIIDITPENYRKYLRKAHERLLRENIRRDRENARKVEKGKEVVVVRGRKTPIGVVGELFWEKEVNFDPYKRPSGKNTRIGIRTKSGDIFWTYGSNVEVYAPEQYETSVRVLNKITKERKSQLYTSIFGKEAIAE